MANSRINGRVIQIHGVPNPNSYIVQGADGQTYLVHVGDIEGNEQLLYSLPQAVKFQVGDTVNFQHDTHERAIHVRKDNQ